MQIDADAGELARDIGGIGIDNLTQQKLGANTENFSAHEMFLRDEKQGKRDKTVNFPCLSLFSCFSSLKVWRKLGSVLGCYVHIPFCARRCPYCDFAVSVNTRADFREKYVAALKAETQTALKSSAFEASDAKFETIFFGGGTPTELSASTLGEILAPLLEKAASNAEVSLEANPENLDFETLRALREGGFNRLSLGAQSFDDGELQVLGRAHNAVKIETVVADARRAGFSNLSIDLIYGAPGTTLKRWQETLRRAIALDVSHISAYSLTIESGTSFGRSVRLGEFMAPDDDFLGDLMDETAKTLGEAGFGRYEVSNWAKVGFESRHNLNYWRGGDYLGLGCGAHGHKNGHRYWNERDAKIYINRLENEGTARAGEEWLTPLERATELVALGLRCREGFSVEEVSKTGAFDARSAMNGALTSFVSSGTLREENGRILPDASAFAVADGLAARLIAQF
jgi:oxygen-independent coproporphyrinogen-3 oxidase